MALFESYERRIDKINAVLNSYGISSLEDAEKFLELGADRLGTSRIVKLIRQEEATGY